MKLYLLNGTHYEKQADVPKGQGKFEAVDFPFAASPKADFVAWLNEQQRGAYPGIALDTGITDDTGDGGAFEPVDRFIAVPQPVEVIRDNPLTFDDAWEQFPIARKLHFAALACEDAREAIK